MQIRSEVFKQDKQTDKQRRKHNLLGEDNKGPTGLLQVASVDSYQYTDNIVHNNLYKLDSKSDINNNRHNIMLKIYTKLTLQNFERQSLLSNSAERAQTCKICSNCSQFVPQLTIRILEKLFLISLKLLCLIITYLWLNKYLRAFATIRCIRSLQLKFGH